MIELYHYGGGKYNPPGQDVRGMDTYWTTVAYANMLCLVVDCDGTKCGKSKVCPVKCFECGSTIVDRLHFAAWGVGYLGPPVGLHYDCVNLVV